MHTHAAIRRHVESHHGHHRIAHILGKAEGGAADEMSDKKMIKRAIGEHDAQLHPGHHTRLKLRDGGSAEGASSARRLDRGGRSGKKAGGKGSHVNVIVAPGQAQPHPVPVPVPAAGGGPGPAAMPPPRPPMMPPGAGPGMPPGAGPGMPPGGLARPPMMPPGGGGPPMMRRDGGRTMKGNDAGRAHDQMPGHGNDADKAHAVDMKLPRGKGKRGLDDAGARSGEGRLEKQRMSFPQENAEPGY